jgi:serine protease Do
VVHELWPLLIKSGNIDEVRLGGAADIPDIKTEVTDNGPAAGDWAKDLPGPIGRAAAATVHFSSWSGVIISADGLIATCAHHGELPGATVTVRLPDGRNLNGKILGMNPIADVGIVKITDSGPFPYVPLGSTSALQGNDPCWVIGYPGGRKEREPLVRKSSLAFAGTPWRVGLYTKADYELVGGDSGGGLFDADGRLIAVHSGQNGKGSVGRHQRVELIKRQWNYLVAGKPVVRMNPDSAR